MRATVSTATYRNSLNTTERFPVSPDLAAHDDAQLAAEIGESWGAWCVAETPAKGLGRLGLVEATDILIHCWKTTVHSSVRQTILEGLHGCALEKSTDHAVEALDDCEPGVQRIACGIAPVTDHTRARLARLRDDPLAPEVRDAAARHLKEGRATGRPQ